MNCARYRATVPDSFCGTNPCCRGCEHSRTDADKIEGAFSQMRHRNPCRKQPSQPRVLHGGASHEYWQSRMWICLDHE